MQYLKIPRERVAVLIGENGGVKKEIEKRTKTKIQIEETSISVEGNSMDEWLAKDIVLGIGRGFNPEIAFKLLNDEITLEIINLKDFVNTEKAMVTKKGRIIGEKGRTKRFIENITGAYLSVYGKSIGIIGSYDDVALAKEAVVRLIHGARHSSVYNFLEKSKSQRRPEIQNYG